MKSWRDEPVLSPFHEVDLQLVDFWQPRILAALGHLWTPTAIARATHTAVIKADDGDAPVTTVAQAQAVVDSLGEDIDPSELAEVLQQAWADSWYAGHAAAGRQLDLVAAGAHPNDPAFTDWKPGQHVTATPSLALVVSHAHLTAEQLLTAAEDFSENEESLEEQEFDAVDDVGDRMELEDEGAEPNLNPPPLPPPSTNQVVGLPSNGATPNPAQVNGNGTGEPGETNQVIGQPSSGSQPNPAQTNQPAASTAAPPGGNNTAMAGLLAAAHQQVADAARQAAVDIGNTTMAQIRDLLLRGAQAGTPYKNVVQHITDLLGGDSKRAEKIAQTETSRMTHTSMMAMYALNGITEYDWLTTASACPICLDRAANNPQKVGKDLPPPAHPYCRCTTAPRGTPGSTLPHSRQHVGPGIPGGTLVSVSPSKYTPISRGQLSNPDTPRSRPVTAAEFQQLASQGEKQYKALIANSAAITGLNQQWDSVKAHAFTQTRSAWGGVTVDAHTGVPVKGDANGYALTVKEPGMDTVHVDPAADQATFNKAMDAAKTKFGDILARQNHYLGVFRDEDTGRIDIDPVLIVGSHHKVETIGAYTHAVGGAYRFKDGLGYWPPHVAEPATQQPELVGAT